MFMSRGSSKSIQIHSTMMQSSNFRLCYFPCSRLSIPFPTTAWFTFCFSLLFFFFDCLLDFSFSFLNLSHLKYKIYYLPNYYRISGFDPPPARVFAWRVLELKKDGVNEDDAMAVADVIILFWVHTSFLLLNIFKKLFLFLSYSVDFESVDLHFVNYIGIGIWYLLDSIL